jgi:hypothetical protein
VTSPLAATETQRTMGELTLAPALARKSTDKKTMGLNLFNPAKNITCKITLFQRKTGFFIAAKLLTPNGL